MKSAAFDLFVQALGVTYDKAVACLITDRDQLLTFYDGGSELPRPKGSFAQNGAGDDLQSFVDTG